MAILEVYSISRSGRLCLSPALTVQRLGRVVWVLSTPARPDFVTNVFYTDADDALAGLRLLWCAVKFAGTNDCSG